MAAENGRVVLRDYRAWLLMSKSPRTAETYYRAAVRLLEFAGTDDPSTITPALVTRFLMRFSPRWANTLSYAIRSFLQFCGLEATARMVPHPRYRPREPYFLTEEEVLRMIRCTDDPRDKALLWCAYELALRAGEVTGLMRDDLDLANQVLRVRRLKQRGGEPLERRYPISDRLASYLATYLASRQDDSPFLFARKGGGRLHRADLSKIFRRAKERAGIERPATFHSLRHARAVQLAIEWRGDVARIADFLGHRNVNSTLLYTSHALFLIGSGTSPSTSMASTT